ncbi:general stress protein [Paracoccidioides lutzii Pb01]|uniref:General stress protein n=1 Tax=Paracoccidioides lutzii (strain ATCC MYA-826 / Pb01) TaxID=502779 RepID=C1HBI4_PARBA|nr:general stress protein [Paracoccidioides lutzii Pb01]EEH37707.2 general stress protein [Paracoccidioides lutzii Pb01]
MASSTAGLRGSFAPVKEPQTHKKNQDMTPQSESTRLESAGAFVEYVGSDKLKDKKVLITGGDSGIGRSAAVLMAREVAEDLMDNDNCKRAIDSHIKEFSTVDVLINNASKQIMCENFDDISLANFESTFRSNILQIFAITKYALPHMKKGSSIINTTSVVAFRGTSSMVDYASTKAAIVGFTRSLSKNLIPKGIRVNAVAPGPAHTPIQPDSRPPEQMKGFGSGSMLGRPGQLSEIAPSFILLASAEGTLYSRQVLHPYPFGD